jgi:O-antigen ligase
MTRQPAPATHIGGRSAALGFRHRRPASKLNGDTGWDLLLIAVAVYLATAVGRIHQLSPVVEALRLTMVGAVLALVLYALTTERRRNLRFVAHPITILLLLLLGWAALSVPGAINDGWAFRMVVDNFAKTVVLYILIVGVVRGRDDVDRLVFVYVLAATLYTAVMVWRHRIVGGQPDTLLYYDANDFATYAVTVLPLATYFALTRRRLWLRVTASVAGVVLATGLVWSGSRGGFLALTVMGAVAVFLYRSIPWRWRLGVPLVIAGVVVAVAGPQYWREIRTLFEPRADYNLTDDSGRLEVWKRGIGYVIERPILGLGADNFPIAEGTISPLAERQSRGYGVKWSAAHNSFLQIAAELGLPGLMLFLGLFVAAFGSLAVRQRAPPDRRSRIPVTATLAQSLTLALVGFAVGAFFLSLAYSAMLYSLLAFAAALAKVTPLRSVPVSRRRVRGTQTASSLQ